MLSIVPYERSGQRDTERPFKSYPHVTSPLYNSFASPTLVGSVGIPAAHTRRSNDYNSTMDMRPPHHMMEQPHHLMDISQGHPGHQSMLGIKHEPPHHENGMGMGMLPLSSMSHHPHYSQSLPPLHGPHTPIDTRVEHTRAVEKSKMSPASNHSSEEELSSPGANSNSSSSREHLKSTGPLKKRAHAVPETQKDNSYWDKRKKNNESAKRSRDARRMKEEQIAMRVVYLEQENLQLRTEVSLLKSEIEKLRCMLYNS